MWKVISNPLNNYFTHSDIPDGMHKEQGEPDPV